jgi:hypothetical protein
MHSSRQLVLTVGLLISCLLYTSYDVKAATINAASCSSADVVRAIGTAGNGDTVIIPACTATAWASAISLTKQITVQGAGITSGANLTSITTNGFNIALTTDGPVRVTGIEFSRNTAGSSDSMIVLNGRNSNGSGTAMTKIRIDHCKFINGGRQIAVNGWSYGVIDHNQFINGNIAVGFTGDGNQSWSRPIQAGTANAMIVEDNSFIMNTSRLTSLNEQIYHQGGSRSVVRYNTFDATANTTDDSIPFETHGNFGPYYTGDDNRDERGQPIMEFYNNTVTVHHTYRMLNVRGGSILVHGNTFRTISGSADVVVFTEEEGWYCAYAGQLCPTRTFWPAQDQVMNSFIWNNTLNGSPVTISNIGFTNASASIFIQQNRDFFMHAPAANGGMETYPGRYGAEDMTFSSSGPNTYYPYTPYTYPHPLVNGTSTADTTPPSPPINLRLQ